MRNRSIRVNPPKPVQRQYPVAYAFPFLLFQIVSVCFVFLSAESSFSQSEKPANKTSTDINAQLLEELGQVIEPKNQQEKKNQQKNLDLLQDLDKELNAGTKKESNQDLLDSLDMELEGKNNQQNDDLLDLLDSGSQDIDSTDISILNQLGSNLNGRFRLRGYHYWDDLGDLSNDEADTRNDFIESLLELSTWMNTDDWRFDLSGWLETGNARDTWSGISPLFQDESTQSRFLELNEVYLRLYYDSFDLTLGKKIFKNGIASVYSPADRYNPRDFSDPIDPKELGIWQIRGDFYWNGITITGAILPVFQNSKIPPMSSRWLSQSADFDFSGLGAGSNQMEFLDEYPSITMDNIRYFLRADTTLQGWDIYTSLYYGLNPMFVLGVDNLKFESMSTPIGSFDPQILVSMDFVKKNVKVINWAAGFSTTYKNWEFHGEGLFNYSSNSMDDNYLHYVTGFTYTIDEWAKYLFMDRIDIIVEYIGTWITRKQSAEGYLLSWGDYRYGHNDILALANLKVNEDLNFFITATTPLDESDFYMKYGGSYKIREGFMLSLSLDEFQGPSDGKYGRWEKNSRIVAELEYRF